MRGSLVEDMALEMIMARLADCWLNYMVAYKGLIFLLD